MEPNAGRTWPMYVAASAAPPDMEPIMHVTEPISYVVVSTPRSGTGYIAQALSRLGLCCGHESCFRPDGQSYWQRAGSVGDASWLAVPFIDRLPPGTVVLHQTRDPVRAINSINSGARYFREWPQTREDYLASDPYRRFILDHTGSWTWPDGETERGAHFWHNWHRWIEAAAARRDDLRYLRYRLEDLDEELLGRVRGLILGEAPIPEAIPDVPRDYNHRDAVRESVSRGGLPAGAAELAERYGY